MSTLLTWHGTWAADVVVTALAALYLRTALHVGGWPVIRTVSSLGALVVAVVTVDSGIGGAAARSFPVHVVVHVVVHLLLLVVVPALWVAGRPGELLRRGASARAAAGLERLDDSAPVRGLTSPATVLAVFALVEALTHLTEFPVASPAPGVLESLLSLGAGLLFFHTAFDADRPYPLRVALVLVAAGVVAAVGILLAGWGPDDVRRGGVITAVAGSGLMLLIAVALGGRWLATRSGTPTSDPGTCPVC